MANYGMRLGVAFQLIDDVLDLSGSSDSIGKILGDDLAEGKPTMPLLIAMREGSSEQRELIRQAIQHGGLEQLPEVLKAVQATGALERVREIAQQESIAAFAAIAHMPNGAHLEALKMLAEFSVNRDY